MRNHDQKAKDMAESVLPSTMNDRRRDRRAIHGRHRARQQVQLRRISAGSTEDFDTGLERRRTGELRDFVLDRRGADKTGPLVRWARARVRRDPALAALDLEDQVRELARLMPDNTIGRHAADHIRWGLKFDGTSWKARERARAAERAANTAAHRAAVAEQVLRVLQFGRHRALNDAIRDVARREVDDTRLQRLPGGTELRLLHGVHDVEAFVAVHAQNTVVLAAVQRLAE